LSPKLPCPSVSRRHQRRILRLDQPSAHSQSTTRQTSVQFVAIADPIETARFDIIKGDKIEISRHTVKVLDTKLIESGEEVLGNVDSLVAHVAAESAERVVGGTLDVSQLIIARGSSGNV
jgi:hypothetical protein